MAELPTEAHEYLKRYLTPTERVVFVQRQHWIVLTKPVGISVGSFLLLILLIGLFNAYPAVTNVMIVAWLVALGWAAFEIVDWYRDWFIGTSSRLLNLSGLFTRKLAMMPLAKVTDMSYIRSPLGKVLGYGTFRVESAGQQQALGTIKWVQSPDETYRKIVSEQFKPAARRATDVRPPVGSGSQLPVVEPDDVWWRR